jgi:hypothetical protein
MLRLDPGTFGAGLVVVIDRLDAGFLGMKGGDFHHENLPTAARIFLNGR